MLAHWQIVPEHSKKRRFRWWGRPGSLLNAWLTLLVMPSHLTWLIIISDDGKLTHKYKWTHFLSTQVTKHEPMGPESARFSLQWIWLMNSVVSGAFGGAGVLHMGHISTCKVISWSATCNLSLLQNIRTSPWRYQMHLQIFRLWDGPQHCRRQ
jgi:hypothetical protein